MKRFKPVTGQTYLICDACRVVTDILEIFTEVTEDEHYCQYCARYASKRKVSDSRTPIQNDKAD